MTLSAMLLIAWLVPVSAPAEPCRAVRDDPALTVLFETAGVTGATVIWKAGEPACVSNDPARANQRTLPASTFKIPNSLIILESGVVSGVDEVLPWDGVDRGYSSWNRDQDMRSALRVSAVWYYREMARRVGLARMEGWLRRVGYGNGHVTGGVDRFWLDGGLRISPVEQVRFLRRLESGDLPFSAGIQEQVREILVRRIEADTVLRAKTGWAIDTKPQAGWFVGWLESSEGTWFFATLIDIRQPEQRHLREALSLRALAAAGAPVPAVE